MNPALIARRVVECVGIVGVYTVVEQSHSYYHYQVDDDHSRNLKKFRLNIAHESAEILEKLNVNLYNEMEKIHQQCKSRDDINVWIKKLLGNDAEVPPKVTPMKNRTEIADKLRLIPVEQRDKSIRLATYSEIYKNNPDAALRHTLNEFYNIENEIIISYTTKQEQISKIMESYRTKKFIESPGTYFDELLLFTKLMGCIAVSSGIGYIWKINPLHLVKHETKLPKYGKILSMSLLILAYYLSEDVKDKNDYLVETKYEAADVSKPQIFRLPFQQFGGITPVVYRPCQTVDDPYNATYTINYMCDALIDGYLFRHLLFNSLLMFSSMRVSHLLAAASASVAACLQEKTEESYYEVKEDKETGSYIVNKNVTHNISFTVPFKPLLLQALLYASRSWHMTIFVDMCFRIREVIMEASLVDDYWMLFRKSDMYGLACHGVAFIDWLSSPILRFADFVKDTPSYTDNISEIITRKYFSKSVKNNEKKSYITTEEIISLEKSALFNSQTMHLPIQRLLPKPFDGKAATMYPVEESQILRNISGVDNDTLARMQAFLEDSERQYISTYCNGKTDINMVRYMLRLCIYDKTWPQDSQERNTNEFVRRFFFWEDEATEDNILDLLQELYEFLSMKRIQHAHDFLYTKGREYMMDLECEPIVDDVLMKPYFEKLGDWLEYAMELEEINFLNRYGLTTHHLQTIISRFSSAQQLQNTWQAHFNAEKYIASIKKKADPIPVYRNNA